MKIKLLLIITAKEILVTFKTQMLQCCSSVYDTDSG